MASLLLLVALLVAPWVLTARRRPAARPSATAWAAPASQRPVRPWADPDEWWRASSALPSRLPRPVAHRVASPIEV